MIELLTGFAVSLCLTLVVIHYSKLHAHLALDHDVLGPQKFHVHPVPRVGGIGIIVGVASAMLPLAWMKPQLAQLGGLLLLAGLPALGAGLVEDLTKRVSPRVRLGATAVSALLAVWLLNAVIRRTDIPGLDWAVTSSFVAISLTVLAVAGIANSVNIIDGFNGLASMCVVIMLAALAYVAFQVGDPLLAALALAGVGAVLGFFVWNFPAGLIFLGDGGAYFLGFYVAELAILLLVRNPEVSPLFPLLVCVYPIFETLFSIYRRRVLRATPPSVPDGIHLHSLIYRRVLRWAVGDRSAKALTRRNSMTSPFLWALCMLSVVPAVCFGTAPLCLLWRWVASPSAMWCFTGASFASGHRGGYGCWHGIRENCARGDNQAT